MSENDVYKLEVIPLIDVLEYEMQATIGITTNQSPHNIIDYLIDNPSVFLASPAIGRFNLVLGVRFQHPNSLSDFVASELLSVQGIGSTETYLHTKRINPVTSLGLYKW
jgi:hypothetical protein